MCSDNLLIFDTDPRSAGDEVSLPRSAHVNAAMDTVSRDD